MMEPGILPGSFSFGRGLSPWRGCDGYPRSGLRVDAASCGLLEPGLRARLPSVGTWSRLREDCTVSALTLCLDAASCGFPKEAGYANRRRRPACYLGAIRMLVGFVLGGPPGRGMARPPAASCGLTGPAMDDRSAGVLAGGAPSSDNLPDQFAIDRRATAWMARRCAVLGREARHICARAGPRPMGREPGKDARLPIAPSRTNARRQDAADAAQSPAARRAAKNKPSHHPDLHKGSRQTSNADPVTSARGRDPARWGGSRARTPGSRLPHRA